MKINFKTMIGILAVLVAGLAINSAIAATITLDFSSSPYLGSVNKATPADRTGEQAFIGHLIGMGLGASDTFGGKDYVRSNNSFSSMPDPTSVLIDYEQYGSPLSISASGIVYIWAKYGQPGFGWVLTGLNDSDTVVIPSFGPAVGPQGNEQELSHYSVFSQSVPDGGLTILLLGLGVGGMALVARKMRS